MKNTIMKADVAIVIVTYNSGDCLRCCIDSLSAQERVLALQIVVVDNNSKDDTVQFPSVTGPS